MRAPPMASQTSRLRIRSASNWAAVTSRTSSTDPGGQSHPCVRPTRASARSSSATMPVAADSRETMRMRRA
ncbi:hypothetical protein [Streptomyces sp. NBC_01538]|uniref:hypothetical protein n=1 Tax=Streptomyces sp. NBC_01538 TaxID=2903897 RepID=UPI003869FD0D